MAAKKRKSGPALKERLLEEFYRFSFFQAVSLIEAMYPEREPLERSLVPSNEAVRFSVKPGFGFPPSELSHLSLTDEDHPLDMGVTFLGLIGPSGILPQWYNSLALERNRQKDVALTSFFDLFHHRLITLFYLAWKKNRFPENYRPGARDRLSRYLLSLSGLGTSGLTERIGLPEESLSFYTGLISRQAPSGAAIEATVAYLSGTRVAVEQFVERTIGISQEDRTYIGSRNSELGVTTVCGSCIRDCQTMFRIHLGPMHYTEFGRFLPTTGDLIRPIFSLVRYMVGTEYEFDLRIRLPHEEIPACELGGERMLQLGWTTWLRSPSEELGEDVFLTLQERDVLHADRPPLQ
ncbi:MAG: type VI secretion system baseplate subunit TssG [Desulfomonilia bacterium]